jgi:hypothetical protein
VSSTEPFSIRDHIPAGISTFFRRFPFNSDVTRNPGHRYPPVFTFRLQASFQIPHGNLTVSVLIVSWPSRYQPKTQPLEFVPV